ncbi:unnamed protein product, partial [Ectocarpus sp. 4 AP-2014]
VARCVGPPRPCACRFFGRASLPLHLMRVHPRVTSIASIGQLTFAGPRFHVAGWHLLSCCSASGSDNVPTIRATHASSSIGRDGMLAMPRHERKAARKSRSFRRRQAPITRGQRRTLRELWPKYGLVMDFERRWDFDQIFAAAPGAAVTFDIGFGSGESLIEMAAMRPEENFVGIEVHKPGVAAALARLEAERLPNVKIAQGDAITALADHIEDGSLSSCCIFFPDPFPQDRDTERREVLRLVRPLLLSLLASKLHPGGTLHVATDVDGYAEHTVRVMSTWTPEKWPKTARPTSSTMPSGTAAAEDTELGFRQLGGVHREEQLQGEELTDGLRGGPQQQQREGSNGDTRLVSEVPGCWVGGETAERPSWRPLTKYEEKAREAGRRVRDFSYWLELPEAGLEAKIPAGA